MSRRNPDPWGDFRRDRDDISTAAAFFMTFALLGLIAWVIFFGTGWIVPAAVDALPMRATRTPASYPSPSEPTSSGIAFPLTAATTTTVASTTSAASVQSAAPTARPKPAPTKLRVGNTGGDGVYLRRNANDSDLWIPWPDNTIVEYMNEESKSGSQTYKKVKDPRGNVGWMPAQYLVAVQ